MTCLLLLAACAPEDDAGFLDGPSSDVGGDLGSDLHLATAHVDKDGDGYLWLFDCNDQDASVHPTAPEVCNDIDDNCDGAIDENLGSGYWYPDTDGDGWGDDDIYVLSCGDPGDPYTYVHGDCDDDDPDINPYATEICDDIDEDCSSILSDVYPGYFLLEWYLDADHDGYGDGDHMEIDCVDVNHTYVSFDPHFPGVGLYGPELDCDDGDPNVHPHAVDVCDNGVDEDCDYFDATCPP